MMNVEVVGYSARWESKYEFEARKIREILGDELVNIFHIGSTSVRGLSAKPIIDIMPVVHDLERVDLLKDRFEALGYEITGRIWILERRYYRMGGGNRAYQLYIFQYNNVQEIERHLTFRDYLRANPDVCYEYSKLKARLAGQFPTDPESYMNGKDDFVKAVERAALKWNYKQRM